MNIENLKIEEVIPYWKNPRKHTEAGIQVIANSIKEFGFNQPLVLDKNRTIIVGHMRFKALMKLGYTEVPCIISDMSQEKAKQYRIIDNKTSELSFWDEEALMSEIKTAGDFELFKDYLPKIEQMQNHVFPTAEGIKIASDNLDDKFAETNQNELSDYIELMCPECGKAFHVKRNDILTRTD